jgi:hypothetical protein
MSLEVCFRAATMGQESTKADSRMDGRRGTTSRAVGVGGVFGTHAEVRAHENPSDLRFPDDQQSADAAPVPARATTPTLGRVPKGGSRPAT